MCADLLSFWQNGWDTKTIQNRRAIRYCEIIIRVVAFARPFWIKTRPPALGWTHIQTRHARTPDSRTRRGKRGPVVIADLVWRASGWLKSLPCSCENMGRPHSLQPFWPMFMKHADLLCGRLENDCTGCHRIEKSHGATRRSSLRQGGLDSSIRLNNRE